MVGATTTQQILPLNPAGAVLIGDATALVADDGGRVFIRGELCFVWDAGDDLGRRLAAVQLVGTKAARAMQVASAFGVTTVTLWRWRKELDTAGVQGLAQDKRGPKGPSRLTPEVVADIRRRQDGASLRAVAAAVGVSTFSVRRALPEATPEQAIPTEEPQPGPKADLPVLAAPAGREVERAAALCGKLNHAEPVFASAGRVPLAGLLLAIPALEATGLLTCATEVFGCLPNGFYGLDTMLLAGVLRTLAGEPRAEGSTRIDPAALGRVLGLDRAPEVKTIRGKITALAATGRAEELLAAMAAAHVARLDASNPDLLAVFYVDGHVRAYQGARKVARTHLSRLTFPAPATVETWISDASEDPVLVVMGAPGASLAMDLHRLLPDLRRAVGDHRRVLVGFDRGGWSPVLFQQMDAEGFDVLTWRKGFAEDVDPTLLVDLTYTDETGRRHRWRVADTTVDLSVGDDEVFPMRQVTLIVANNLTGRGERGQDSTRQIHILTTRSDLPVEQVIYRMGSRWRRENYFRYARMHFDLDSHDAQATTQDDPTRLAPNPAKKKAHQQVLAARARYGRALAATEAALLDAVTPSQGESVLITNTDHDQLIAVLRAAESNLNAAQGAHRAIPARLPLAQVNPGQQVLDVQTKLITHAIRIAAFNTATTLMGVTGPTA
jgi:transposase